MSFEESGVYMSDNINDKARTSLQIPPGSFTVEMAYYMCDLNFTTNDYLLDAQGSTAGNGLHIRPRLSGFEVRTKAVGGPNLTENISFNHEPGWHYLAFTHNEEDSINRLWIDGVRVDTFQAAITPANFIVIGGNDNNFSGSFNGLIDDIVISDTSLYEDFLLINSIYPNMTEHAVAKWSF